MTVDVPWKRTVRFISEDGQQLCGEPVNSDVDVGLAVAEGRTVAVNVLNSTSPLNATDFTGEEAIIRKLLSPLSVSDVGTIRCVGLNFKDHAAELNLPLPSVPTIFMKPAQCLNNPLDPIIIPNSAPEAIDAEVELVIVIGEDCKDATVDTALDYVLGYTIANDVTARDVQNHTSQWGYCKGYDGFCPLGPTLVSAKSTDLSNLSMRTILNDDVLQNGTTAEMIFSVAEIVTHMSKDTTLPKGTIILTGTPSGIGHSYNPPKYMKAGSELSVFIEQIGTLINPVVANPPVSDTAPTYRL